MTVASNFINLHNKDIFINSWKKIVFVVNFFSYVPKELLYKLGKFLHKLIQNFSTCHSFLIWAMRVVFKLNEIQ